MPAWEEWLSSPGRGQCLDFPRLEKLTLEKSPKLRGNLPDHLPSLKKPFVSDCGVIHERVTRTRWIPWSLIVNTKSLPQSLQELKMLDARVSLLLETENGQISKKRGTEERWIEECRERYRVQDRPKERIRRNADAQTF
ncbi:hypothetical protein PS2_028053 [Malus domestica]